MPLAFDLCQTKAEREGYLQVYQMLADMAPQWPLFCSISQMNYLIKAVLVDHPEIFWFEGKWRSFQQESLLWVLPLYTFSKEALPDAKAQLDQQLQAFHVIQEFGEGACAEYVYNRMLRKLHYGMSGSQGQTAYDALVRGQAVCKGISKAYQLILTELGVFATLAEGSLDGHTKHVWNVVRIEGRYSNVDLCMGLPPFSSQFRNPVTGEKYRVFAASDNQIRRTHSFSETYPYRIHCL